MKQYPFPLKPMSTGNILDYTFRIYRNNFKNILVFSGLISGLSSMILLILTKAVSPQGIMNDPWSLIIRGIKSGNFGNFFENYMNNTSSVPAGPEYFLRSILVIIVSYGGALLISIFITPFAKGGITNISSRYFHGVRLDTASSLKETWKQYGMLITTGLSLMVCYMGFGVLSAILMLFIIPVIMVAGIGSAGSGTSGSAAVLIIIAFILFILILLSAVVVFTALISFVYPAAVSEKKYHFNAIGRSFKLVWKKFWRVLGINTLVYALVYIVTGAISALAFAAALLSPVDIMFEQVITILVTALAVPITYIASTVLYMDVKIRVEGYDLDLLSDNLESDTSWEQPHL